MEAAQRIARQMMARYILNGLELLRRLRWDHNNCEDAAAIRHDEFCFYQMLFAANLRIAPEQS